MEDHLRPDPYCSGILSRPVASDQEGISQLYLFSSNTRNMIPSESAATETNSSPTHTSGAGFGSEFCCDIVFLLNHAILCRQDDHTHGTVGSDQFKLDLAEILVLLTDPVNVKSVAFGQSIIAAQ